MHTQKQIQWIDSLPDNKYIKIFPYDSTCEEKFQILKEKIENAIGKDFTIEHRGASSMGISGQDEIDVYIPIDIEQFDYLIKELTKLFERPASNYPGERVRFQTNIDGKKIDVFMINKNSDGWIDGVKFENYLKENSEVKEEYKKLKESMDGYSIREYYRKKIEYINRILRK